MTTRMRKQSRFSKAFSSMFYCFFLVLLFTGELPWLRLEIYHVNALSSSSAKISSRLLLSVCGQRSQYFDSKTLQKPITSAADFESESELGFQADGKKVGCGWFLLDSSTSQNMYKTCEDGQVQSQKAGTRIIGGKDAEKGQFPSMVSLGYTATEEMGGGYSHNCGGIILAKNWVLTARHCVEDKPPRTVWAGEHDFKVDEGTEQVVKASQKFLARTLNGTNGLDNDIALLKVSPDLIFNEFVAPASLPPPGYEPSGTLLIAGWGFTKVYPRENSTGKGTGRPPPIMGDKPTILQFLPIPVVPREICKELITSRDLQPNEVCVAFDDGQSNPCYGDSGGPLYADIEGNVTVVGTLSKGTSVNCTGIGKPGIYMKISFPLYTEWIKKTIEENP